jgi:hypothetical protein
MSNDQNEQPVAGSNPHLEYERGREDFTPEPGHLMVRQGDGTAMLTSTDKTFGKGRGHREGR